MILIKSQAQTIITTPTYPTDQDSTIVIYDASKGNGELMNVAPPIYAHTGVITNLSASPTDWRYVVADWTVNLPKALMTPLGNNLYKLTLQPDIRGYYGVPSSETIEKIAFVFRNSDGLKVGREANGSDIYADVYSTTFSVNIILPQSSSLFLKQNTPIPVLAKSPLADSLFLFVNDNLVKSIAGVTISDTLPAENFGTDWQKNYVKILAKNGTGAVADSFSYTVIPDPPVAALPAGVVDGINYINDTTVILCLFAPFKMFCFVTGDFNNWQTVQDGYMNVTPDSTRYWIEITHLLPQKEYIYQYLVDGNLAVGDPYADKVSDPQDQDISPSVYPGLLPYPTSKANGVATVLQTGQQPYSWQTVSFIQPDVKDLVIYETLIRDFTTAHTYQSVMDTLNYLKELGINAIELMPVMEFEGNSSWSYNPDFMFAPDKYYGPKNKLKDIIDAAHQKGIAVILDIVLNHQFGQSPLVKLYWDDINNRPAANSPWFNQVPKHPYNVGYDFNHESQYTKAFCQRVIRYWLTEYKVDGYRFDLSKGFTQVNSYPDNVALWGQFDPSRIEIIKSYYSTLRSVNPDAYLILEHFAENPEEKDLSLSGMLLWGNMNFSYNEATMAWNNNSDFSGISYIKREWAAPHLVGYMESHDEERLAFKNVTYGNSLQPYYNIQDTGTSLKRLELAATFFFTIPGPKMIWQFGELGYDYSINYPSGTSSSRLSPKPVRWDYLNDWRRNYTKNIFSTLINLKKTQPVFSTSDYSLDLAGPVKRIRLRHETMDAVVLGNFDVVSQDVIPSFNRTGKWYEYFTGDSLDVADTIAPLSFLPGDYRIYTTTKLEKPYFTGIGDNPSGEAKDEGHVIVFPNPSEGSFIFRVNLGQPAMTSITLYDMLGNEVNRIIPGYLPAGTSNFEGKINSGNSKSLPGIYFYRLDAGNIHEYGKLMAK
jgi:1,4-alpha-glucan branching enzyme